MLCCICAFPGVLQRKWYRNFLMKGFHLVVLLTAGPGIRDTQVCFANISRTINSCGQFCFGIVLWTKFHFLIANLVWFQDVYSSCCKETFYKYQIEEVPLLLCSLNIVMLLFIKSSVLFLACNQVVFWCWACIPMQAPQDPNGWSICKLDWNTWIQSAYDKHPAYGIWAPADQSRLWTGHMENLLIDHMHGTLTVTIAYHHWTV